MSGYKERNRGGHEVFTLDGSTQLYDHRNNLLNTPNRVWCVFRCSDEFEGHCCHILESVWQSYDEAFDRAESIDGALEHYDMYRKNKK